MLRACRFAVIPSVAALASAACDERLDEKSKDLAGPTPKPSYLTPGQILIIKRWIQLGARND